MERSVLNHKKPKQKQQEHIAVIGSGIAGCLAAQELAEEGFRVSIIEEHDKPFSGTSLGANQVHLGGLYSASPETALECLTSAIALKKAFPEAINDRKTLFLVANKSDESLADYLEFYEWLVGQYAKMPLEDRVFGAPDSLYRVLQPDEYAFAKNIQGGIASQEPGLDMVAARETLLGNLERLGVEIQTGTAVLSVRENGGKFTLDLRHASGTKQATFDQVVNAGGYKASLLDRQLGDHTVYNLYLKTWNRFQTPAGQAELPPFYVVRGDFIIYRPIGPDGLVCLIASNHEGSFLDTIRIDGDNPELPPEWTEIMASGLVPEAGQRQQNVLDYAKDMFLGDLKFVPHSVVPGVAVSYSDDRNDRTQRNANQVTPGWQSIVPTKATHALDLARQVRRNAVAQWQAKQ